LLQGSKEANRPTDGFGEIAGGGEAIAREFGEPLEAGSFECWRDFGT
jgi:hypothetical protein